MVNVWVAVETPLLTATDTLCAPTVALASVVDVGQVIRPVAGSIVMPVTVRPGVTVYVSGAPRLAGSTATRSYT